MEFSDYYLRWLFWALAGFSARIQLSYSLKYEASMKAWVRRDFTLFGSPVWAKMCLRLPLPVPSAHPKATSLDTIDLNCDYGWDRFLDEAFESNSWVANSYRSALNSKTGKDHSRYSTSCGLYAYMLLVIALLLRICCDAQKLGCQLRAPSSHHLRMKRDCGLQTLDHDSNRRFNGHHPQSRQMQRD